MNSKIFLYILMAFFILITISFGMMNFFFYKVPQSTIWIDNCFIKKDSYAKSILDKKIVFTSGSNTLYGMETNIIEKALNIPVVNMAIHAGLKTDYILYRAKKILNSGDIIILPFEYQNLTWDGEEEESRSDYVLTHDKDFFLKELSLKEKLSMIYSITPINLINSLKEQLSITKEAQIGKGYTSITLNKNGDETYKDGYTNKKHKPFELPERHETLGLEKIKDFNKWCKENNIRLFVTFPNTINHKEYFQEPYNKYFNTLLEYFSENKIEVIGKPVDSLYPINYFYDTNYHMNKKGAEIRTEEFLGKLKIKL